ncbi:hypothetical protein [Streptomyces mirabilis]|uniref:hypothetical protein n=1 Tax=Streptomyces mirabilis TaxID=68239 RepID=UPI003683BAEF
MQTSAPADAVRAWQREGLLFEDALTGGTWDRLIAEAKALRGEASESGFTNTAAHRDGSFCTPSRYLSVKGGPMLTAVSRDTELLALVREATALPRLIPVRCGYNYYRPGDYMGLHRDSVKATITVTFALSEGLPPMGWAPDLADTGGDDLAALVQREGCFPDGFAEREVPFCQLSAFDGYNIPHWRPLVTGPEQAGVLGTFCFFNL